jgi:hypothetical protein
MERSEPVRELRLALDRIELGYSQQTEPDIILRVAGWGWIFIEAKLASPTSTFARNPRERRAWIARYAEPSSNVFELSALQTAEAQEFPEQLLRNVALANAVQAEGDQALVVALVRRRSMVSWSKRVHPGGGILGVSRSSLLDGKQPRPGLAHRKRAPVRRVVHRKEL